MEGIINWFAKNHVTANFLMAIVLLLGFSTWFKLKKEIFPETNVDTIAVRVPYPNATPEEVEKGIVIPIEEAIQDLDGIEELNSTSAEGTGVVLVQVASGYDVRNLMDDVKTRVDAIQNLAEEAEEPVMEELLIKNQVMSIAVSAETDEKTLRKLTEEVRDSLLNYELTSKELDPDNALAQLPLLSLLVDSGPVKVTQAELAGVRDYEISIEVSEDTLRQYGLTFSQVANAVRNSSLDLPGGSVDTSGGEVLIRTEARRYTAAEFAPITVTTRPDGSVVKLEDISVIRDGFEDVDIATRFDNRPTMLINVYRVGNQDTLKIAKLVRKFVYEEAPRLLPDGVKLEIWKDDSVFLEGRMNLLMKNGIFGLVLVAVVLALFLRPSLALLVAVGIPVSFAGAIWMMPQLGIAINMISLFAFILVLGIVVDDAIVVGENVYRRMREGEDPRTAAVKGTHEVGVVVIFGVLTTMMAFTPMLGLSGVSGKIWPNIPLVVIPTLFFSLLQSKLVLPSHLACLKRYDPDHEPGPILRFQRRFSRGLETFIEKVYRPTLRLALHSRWVVLCGFICVFFATSAFVGLGWIRFSFFPDVEADIVSAKLTMPKGVPYETTVAAVKKMEDAALLLNEEFTDKDGNSIIKHIMASTGTQPFQVSMFNAGGIPKDVSLGEVTIELQPSANRDVTGDQITSRWRELTGDIPGAVELTFQAQAAGGGNAIDLQLNGPNLDDLDAAAQEVKNALGEFEGVIDIADSNREGKRELKLNISPSAEALGLRLGDLARQMRQGFYGEEIQRLQRGRDEVKVFVRYPKEERASLSDIQTSKVRTQGGAEVPFSEVAEIDFGRSYSTIQRSDRRRSITITADIDNTSGANANEVVASLEAGTLKDLRKSYPDIRYSFEGEQKDQRQALSEMMTKFILALIGMYVLMAVPLKSYIQPLIVMCAIPFGLIGAVYGHVIMGFELSIMSMCGIVALAGVVVNDSLVLVDYVNRHRAEGFGLVESAWEAGAARFRPILLTSLTTFAGLTPMLLETDIQAKFLIPMAVSLGFGIMFATGITLFLVPSVYLILHDVKTAANRVAVGLGLTKTEIEPVGLVDSGISHATPEEDGGGKPATA